VSEDSGPRERRVALVTGASRGIGRAIALRLAAEGHAVVVNFRQDAAAADEVVTTIRAGGGDAEAIQVDLNSEESAATLVAGALAWRGRVDFLVNNAAMMRVAPPDTLTERDFRRVIEVNLIVPFALTWQLRQEIAARGGSVVNIGSVAGAIPSGDRIPYCTSKAAMDMLTRSCAMAMAPVRVNCVAPGSIQTDALSTVPESYIRPMLNKTALRRAGQPDEVASAVSYLLSDEASYITGETLYVTGGTGR
jgi:3-oxoacyl-[acyl-carrier protein] reductase